MAYNHVEKLEPDLGRNADPQCYPAPRGPPRPWNVLLPRACQGAVEPGAFYMALLFSCHRDLARALACARPVSSPLHRGAGGPVLLRSQAIIATIDTATGGMIRQDESPPAEWMIGDVNGLGAACDG